jgi:hypothetical protein
MMGSVVTDRLEKAEIVSAPFWFLTRLHNTLAKKGQNDILLRRVYRWPDVSLELYHNTWDAVSSKYHFGVANAESTLNRGLTDTLGLTLGDSPDML